MAIITVLCTVMNRHEYNVETLFEGYVVRAKELIPFKVEFDTKSRTISTGNIQQNLSSITIITCTATS